MTFHNGCKAAAMVGLLWGAAACTHYPAKHIPKGFDAKSEVQRCCRAVELYPDPIIHFMEPRAATSDLLNKSHFLRSPYLKDKPQAWEPMLDQLQPMDIILTSDKSQLSGYMIPGYFTHSVVHLGTESQLRRAGLWDVPALRPHHDKIRNGQIFIEATPPSVTFSAADHVFDVDSAGLFRPTRLTTQQKRDAITQMIPHLGKPFDMHMYVSNHDQLFCAELIDIGMPSLSLPRQSAYGRHLILPDGIAAMGVQEDASVRFVGFLSGQKNKAEILSAESLAATINRYWPHY